MLISPEQMIIKILKEPEVQAYLSTNDLDPVYEYFSNVPSFRSELTKFLLKIDINPIEYVTQTYEQMYQNTSIKNITIPQHIREISSNCFAHCKELRFVKISEGLKTLGDLAFCRCMSLQEIVLPESVNYIGSLCFKGCISIKHITILGDRVQIEPDSMPNCDFVLRCHKDSNAHIFAEENDLTYELI